MMVGRDASIGRGRGKASFIDEFHLKLLL